MALKPENIHLKKRNPRGIPDDYTYFHPTDTIADITASGYFSGYSFTNDNPTFTGFDLPDTDTVAIQVQCADGPYEVQLTGGVATLAAPDSVDIRMFATPQDAVDYCAANSKILTGQGVFNISEPVNMGGISVDMPNGVFYINNDFSATADAFGILVGGNTESPASGQIRKVVFGIDGNKSGQSAATIGVLINAMSAPLADIQIKGRNCYTLLTVRGNSEKLSGRVSGYNCDLILHEKDDGGQTPDENYWQVSGSECEKLYRCEGSTSSTVHFNCENTTAGSEYCVELLGSKYNALSGEIRGINGNGVLINDTAGNLLASFNELTMISFTGANECLNVVNVGTLTGSMNVKGASTDNVATIDAVDVMGDFSLRASDITLTSASNYCVELGEGSNICKRTTLNLSLSSIVTGKAVNHINTEQCTVNVNCATGEYNFSTNALDDFVSLPANYIQDDIPLNSSASQAPTVEIRGNFSTTDLDAFSTGFEGVYVTSVRTWDSSRGFYVTNGFSPADRMEYASTANLQDISHRINTKGKYTAKFVRNTNTREVLQAENQNASGTWRDMSGTTVYTPV